MTGNLFEAMLIMSNSDSNPYLSCFKSRILNRCGLLSFTRENMHVHMHTCLSKGETAEAKEAEVLVMSIREKAGGNSRILDSDTNDSRHLLVR